ncbi:MAG: hypothetical protein Q9219_005347 [cf. Caloplaca sp. 3 TL-2023]
MSNVNEPASSILYQDEDQSTILIDIPGSISEAQESPYPSIEPNNQKARQRVEARLQLGGLTEPTFPQDLLVQGLAKIHAAHAREFSARRECTPQGSTNEMQTQPERETSQPKETIGDRTIARCNADKGVSIGSKVLPRKPLFISSVGTTGGCHRLRMADITNRLVSNSSPKSTQLLLVETAQKYNIPPLSTFMLSQIGWNEAACFSRNAYQLLPEPTVSAAPGQFDFILIDPPWENRSARRSGHYQTRRNFTDDPMDVLQEMLGKHIAPNGLVACWITNKKRVRDAALQVFQAWGVELVEEWAWLKTTVDGDPICPIDGIVRRPYEILLLGRPISLAIDSIEDAESDKLIRKRLIVGVPDIHSRKPCLKALVEPMMMDASNYRALEVFARNLTAGWWSWGDEVLKFNREDYWKKAARLTAA